MSVFEYGVVNSIAGSSIQIILSIIWVPVKTNYGPP